MNDSLDAGRAARLRRVAGMIAAIAWFAVAGQFTVSAGRAAGLGEPLWTVPVNLLGFFTIWANILVALVTMFAPFGWGGLLGRPAARLAVFVYIVVVGLIYNILLVGLYPLAGFGLFVDTLLHRVVPVLYALWWLVLVPRGSVGWATLLPGLVVPTLYAFVAMGKGAATGRYPYPFLDIGVHGIGGVMINIGGLVALFAGLMAVAIAWDRRAAPRAAA
ncbi:hypothetical protein GCM10011529_05390 [Polymorphobacter glacialis]|uniref:Pr6Pr family membrane protein n=1 Tax=Sandarakinorhabdus glacialis TaxID=1614636 RepID=A0A916ZL58_9SPHN|nr:Pr6Pr family membrane protein [Polymorphobacter glacialis]GGE01927.1 hypothetical protein GCM10011529_05390 [Polymorphobacter glacialis]